MIVYRCSRENSPDWVRRQFLADTHASRLKGKYGAITKRCSLLMKFLRMPDTHNLIENIELTKTEVTVRINPKWPNLDCPSFFLVGRHLTFPVTTKNLYSLGGVRVPYFEIWPVIIQGPRMSHYGCFSDGYTLYFFTPTNMIEFLIWAVVICSYAEA
jgi:hypothetical protein